MKITENYFENNLYNLTLDLSSEEFEKLFVRCNSCGKIVLRDDEELLCFDGKYYCSDCTFECLECGEVLPICHSYSVCDSSSLYCRSCYENETYVCHECGGHFRYLTKISSNKGWFYNDENFKLIGDIIDSKMAILNSKGEIHSTSGFSKGEDGNFYSNDSYKDSYGYFGGSWYGYGDFDIESDGFSLMKLSKGETVYYDDGTTEDFDPLYHSEFPTFLSLSGNIFACYDGKPISKTIDAERLSFIGTGCIAEEKQFCSNDSYSLPFRHDVTVFSLDYDDLDWMCG